MVFLDDGHDVVKDLLAIAEFEFELIESVTYSKCAQFYNLAHHSVFTCHRVWGH